MTKDQAIKEAIRKYNLFGQQRVVIERTDHPSFPGQTVYMIAKRSEIRKLSPGSKIIFNHGA